MLPATFPPGHRRDQQFHSESIDSFCGAAGHFELEGHGSFLFRISPQVGAVRGNSTVVSPTVTTAYTLYGTNQYREVNRHG